MCHIDGTIHKTEKAVLTKILEETIETHGSPTTVDVQVYDGFAIFHEMLNIPAKFGQISLSFLKKVCDTSANEIHLIFDTYKTPSIKNTEHVFRNSFSVEFRITGSEQTRPANFSNELRNESFKTSLVKFLIEHWSSNVEEVKQLIGNKTLYINFYKCQKLCVQNDSITVNDIPDYFCSGHEEADTKIIFHVCKIERECNVLLRCSDTDVLVIMLANICHLLTQLQIWMDFGTGIYYKMYIFIFLLKQ